MICFIFAGTAAFHTPGALSPYDAFLPVMMTDAEPILASPRYRTDEGLVRVEPDEEGVGRALCERLKLEATIGCTIGALENRKFSFAISGGSMLQMLSYLEEDDIEWDKCVMGFVSHRCVPLDDEGSTYGKALKFLQKWMDRGLTVLTLGGTSDAEAEAIAYEAKLKANVAADANGYPSFDLALIGVGTDGHVGSIYPNIPDVDSTRAVVPITGKDGMGKISTKLSLSIQSMLASKAVVVACAGKSVKSPLGKAEAMVRALEADETPMSFPASALRFKAHWLLDADSASLLGEKWEAAPVDAA